MLSEEVLENENRPETSAQVLHFGQEVEVLEGVTDAVVEESLVPEGLAAETSKEENAEAFENQYSEAASVQENVNVSFRAEGFSVYGVVYTVDFHWAV